MLDIATRYPGQIATGDPGYPQGKAQNVTSEGDGTGTPLEEDLVNDLFGFQQALLANALLTPTGTPDMVGASQQLDAVKFAADMGRLKYNVKLRGATGLGVVDESAIFTATETALASLGGGAVFLPPGRYVLSANWVKNPLVDWVAIPGTVTVTRIGTAGGGDEFILINTGTSGREMLIHGVDFEADSDMTGGTLFQGQGALTAVLVRFRQCRVNRGSARLKGKIVDCNHTGSKVTFDRCDVNSLGNGSRFRAYQLEITGGDVTRDPINTTTFIDGQPGGLRIEGVTFHQTPTGAGGGAFIEPAGVCHIHNNTFDVDDSGATGPTYAISTTTDAMLFTSGNHFGVAAPYRFVGTCLVGSELQLQQDVLRYIGTGTVVTLDDSIRSVLVQSTSAIPPTVNLPNILTVGQEMDLAIWNNHGSGTWATPVLLVGPLVGDTASLSGLPDTKVFSARFVAKTVGGVNKWVQIGAWVQATVF
jgi:hypothetical protein